MDSDDEEEGPSKSSMGPLVSPMILPISILFYSACQPTIAGIPYVILLIIFVIIRNVIFRQIQSKNAEFNNNLNTHQDLCIYNIPFMGPVSNISIFVSLFTLMYVFLPMLILTNFNALIIVLLSCYTMTMIGLQFKCYNKIPILIGDIFFALAAGSISIGIIMGVNKSMNTEGKNFLFLNSVSSTGEKCSMASGQNFVCEVYKNGQLVSQTPNIPGMSSSTPAYA